MSRSIGLPVPDCGTRRAAARARRNAVAPMSERRGEGDTTPNGEETAYGMGFAANYHKGLPHDPDGSVHCPSYHTFVRVLSGQETGAVETLPLGTNRSGLGTPEDPRRYTTPSNGADNRPLGYRKLTSPFTGHVFDTEGADAGALAIPPAPRIGSDELAAEMAELYAMALLRDVPFTNIADDSGPNVQSIVHALDSMPWFKPDLDPDTRAERRRYASRGIINSGADLFRGSTPGAKNGPWVSQFLLTGNSNASATFQTNSGGNAPGVGAGPDFRGTRANVGHNDGFVFFGTQIVDQRSIVAKEGIDYMTNWASWLDCQNGVDFNNFDVFRDRRRYLTTPRDIATYVHYDALYQAYLVGCLLMLAEGGHFPKDRGLPETNSRTRAGFASFGGPHILSLVTEVATRALKAVWRQKWQHHRRARPEVVAAWLTLHANDPMQIKDESLREALQSLRGKIPQSILDLVNDHNALQNQRPDLAIEPLEPLPAEFPKYKPVNNEKIENYLLPMAFPEGSPTHPAYGAGHATVAGACVTVLKAFFEMYESDGRTELAWPLQPLVASWTSQNANEGGELVAAAPAATPLTIQGELDKLAANISIARNMAGVHYFTDYYESLRLGERIAVSILEEHLSMYSEPVSMSFASFDGATIRISANGDAAAVHISIDGQRSSSEEWYAQYA
jgi:hypothetical protein